MKISHKTVNRWCVFGHIAFILLLCMCQSKSNDHSQSNGSIDTLVSAQEIDNAVNFFQLKDINGVWWLDSSDNSALFSVYDDSLYYTEDQLAPYFIEIKGDSLKMSRDGTSFTYKIKKLSGDSLILYSEKFHETTKLFKYK